MTVWSLAVAYHMDKINIPVGTLEQGPIKRFINGDIKTRLSYLLPGFGCFFNKQVARGVIIALTQVIFWVFIAIVGWPYISKLGSLGTQGPHFEGLQQVAGDNSALILLYGSACVVLMGLMLSFHLWTTKIAYQAQVRREYNKEPIAFKKDLKNLLDKNYAATIMALPLAGILLFSIFPFVFMVLIAFTNFSSATMPPMNFFRWVGFKNFITLFSSSATLRNTMLSLLGWTLIWAFFATFSNYFLGMGLAMLINKKIIKAKKMWRTIFVVTIAVPSFVSLLVMKQFLGARGPLGGLFADLGLVEKGSDILNDPKVNANVVRIIVILVNIWIGIPYTMLITTGILMNIPQEQYESAKLDGAGAFKQYWYITLPFVLFVTAPYLITQFVGNLNNFNVIYLLTGGGPTVGGGGNESAGKTDLMVTWLYKLAMTNREQAYDIASAVGIIVFIVTAGFSLLAFAKTGTFKESKYD